MQQEQLRRQQVWMQQQHEALEMQQKLMQQQQRKQEQQAQAAVAGVAQSEQALYPSTHQVVQKQGRSHSSGTESWSFTISGYLAGPIG